MEAEPLPLFAVPFWAGVPGVGVDGFVPVFEARGTDGSVLRTSVRRRESRSLTAFASGFASGVLKWKRYVVDSAESEAFSNTLSITLAAVSGVC